MDLMMIKDVGNPQQVYTLWECDWKQQHCFNNISHLHVV